MNGNRYHIRKVIFCIIVFWMTLDSHTVVAQSGMDSLIERSYRYEENVYGQGLIACSLMKRTYLSERTEIDSKNGYLANYGSWFFLNSLYVDTTTSTLSYYAYENPLWKYGWRPHKKRIPNKKDFKTLLKLARTYLVHEKTGVELSEVYKSNSYSAISGTALLSLTLNQLEWPYKVKRYNGHLFIVIYGEEPFIIDCSKLEEVWAVDGKKSDYHDFLVKSNCIEAGMSLSQLIEQSEEITPIQLVVLQKIAESEYLVESDPAEAFYRMEVAYFLAPNPELKKRLILAAEKLFASPTSPDDWHKVYAMMNYSRLTGDQSPDFKKEFNGMLQRAFIYYSENDVLKDRHPIYMSIESEDKSKGLMERFVKVALKDTMSSMAELDYAKYLGFDVVEPYTRGMFHYLNFGQSLPRSESDLEFYVDGLYAYTYFYPSSELFSMLYDLDITNYDNYDDIPFMLERHYKRGVLTEYAYHETSAIFLLSYLDHNAPKDVDEVNKISISALQYSVYLEDLGEHLSFAYNPLLIEKATAYVQRMEPIYRDKFMSDNDKLQRIAEICGITTQLDAYDKMSPEEQAEDLIRRLNLMKLPEK